MSNSITTNESLSFPRLVQEFFTEYLVSQRALSSRTIASYRDTLVLFLNFANRELKTAPTELKLIDMQPELILAFLNHLEQERHNKVRSRNLRLTALRTFVRFAARRDITSFHVMEKVLAIPTKRFGQPILGFLTREEMKAVLNIPVSNWTSKRDHLLFVMLYNTGARVSEIINVKVIDVVLGDGACVHLRGKGRKSRSVPLWKSTASEIRDWLILNTGMCGESVLLPNRDGRMMSRYNVNKRLKLAVSRAIDEQPSIANKIVTPHILRHTTAMHLLQSGVPFNIIALWLGHESVNTTHRYVQADLAMKEEALSRLDPIETNFGRFKAPDSLMAFLMTL